MANNLAYLELRLSGGASNTDPDASLGGIKSSQRITGKVVTGLSHITGVVIDDAPGNSDGQGVLYYNQENGRLFWEPPYGTQGLGVDVSTDGRYVITGDDGVTHLLVTVDASSLPATTQSDTITIAQAVNALFDDISKAESFAGDTEYRCLYLHNAHPTDAFLGVKIYISQQPSSGEDLLAIGFDAAGVGNGSATGVAATVANEGTAPSGVTFYAPESANNAIQTGELAAGASQALWQRRSIDTMPTQSTAADVSVITFIAGY